LLYENICKLGLGGYGCKRADVASGVCAKPSGAAEEMPGKSGDHLPKPMAQGCGYSTIMLLK